MSARALVQEMTVVAGTTANGDSSVIQPMDQWLDLGNYRDFVFTAYVRDVVVADSDDKVDLAIITADHKREGTLANTPDGFLWDVATWEDVAAASYYKQLVTLEQATVTSILRPVDRWVAWALVAHKNGASGGPFQVTFEIAVTMKTQA